MITSEKLLSAFDMKTATIICKLRRSGEEYQEIVRRITSASEAGFFFITVIKINEENTKSLTDLGYKVTSENNPNGNSYTNINWG